MSHDYLNLQYSYTKSLIGRYMFPMLSRYIALSIFVIALFSEFPSCNTLGEYCKPPFQLAGDNNCYLLQRQPASSWYNHWDDCAANGGNLVVFTANNQLTQVRQLILDKIHDDIAYSMDYWIDLKCTSGVFTSYDGTVQSFQPNPPTVCTEGSNYILPRGNYSQFIATGLVQTGSICQFLPPLAKTNIGIVCPLASGSVVQIWQSKNHCFYWMETNETFHYARLQCKSLIDSDLADLSSVDDYHNFIGLAEGSESLWIGLHRSHNISYYNESYYALNGEELQAGGGLHSYWASGHPIANQYCGMVQKDMDGILSESCNQYVNVLCSIELPLPSDHGTYCRPPYELVEDGNCYWIRKSLTTRVLQRDRCLKSGGDLAEIRTDKQLEVLRKLLQRKISYDNQFNQTLFIGFQVIDDVITFFGTNVSENFSIHWQFGSPRLAFPPDYDVELEPGDGMATSFTEFSTSRFQSYGAACHYLPYTGKLPRTENGDCPSSSEAFTWRSDDRCFYHFNRSFSIVNWHAARHYCQERGLGDLAVSISNLLQSIPTYYNIHNSWVGIHLSWVQNDSPHKYYYADGTPLLDPRWKANTPYYSNFRSCVAFSSASGLTCLGPSCNYKDAACDATYGFICEWRNSTDIETTTMEEPTTATATMEPTTPDLSTAMERETFTKVTTEAVMRSKYPPLHSLTPPDLCNSHPCMFNSTCVSRAFGFICICPDHIAGYRCDQPVLQLCNDNNPCQRGSQCYLTAQENIYCECAPGFTGQFCETDVDECKSLPCFQGTCHNSVGFFRCLCPDGYTGKQCEYEINECLSQPCRSNSPCSDRFNDYFCNCTSGTSGKSCEVNNDDCPPAACKNGGYCEDGINTYICHCPTHYSGTNCDDEDTDLKVVKAVSRGLAIIAILAIVAVFIVMAILDIIKICCQKSFLFLTSKKEKKKKYRKKRKQKMKNKKRRRLNRRKGLKKITRKLAKNKVAHKGDKNSRKRVSFAHLTVHIDESEPEPGSYVEYGGSHSYMAPVPFLESELYLEPEPYSAFEAHHEREPNAEPEPKSKLESNPVPEGNPAPEPNPVPKPNPALEPNPASEHYPAPEHNPEPKPNSEPVWV